MKFIELLSLLTIVGAAPLINISALSPAMTSVQNIQGPNYAGAIPPPWITGRFSPAQYYGASQYNNQVAPPPPPQVNFNGNQLSNNGSQAGNNPSVSQQQQQQQQQQNFNNGDQPSSGSNSADFFTMQPINQESATKSPAENEETFKPSPGSSDSNSDTETPVNDSTNWGDNSPPPTFQFNM